MTTDRLDTTERIERGALWPVVHVGVALVGMIALLALSLLLPGSDHVVLEPGVTVANLILGVATLGIVAALLYAAPRVRNLLSAWLEGPSEAVASAAAIGTYLVDFVAVLIAHQGFEPVLAPLLGAEWLYDLLFLGIALCLLGAMAYRYYLAMEPITAFVTERVAGRERRGAGTGDDARV
jgi:hypothetical protein